MLSVIIWWEDFKSKNAIIEQVKEGDKWTQNYVIKKPKVKIVFFDIDDTLRAKETGLIPESVKDVFHQLKKEGNFNRDL